MLQRGEKPITSLLLRSHALVIANHRLRKGTRWAIGTFLLLVFLRKTIPNLFVNLCSHPRRALKVLAIGGGGSISLTNLSIVRRSHLGPTRRCCSRSARNLSYSSFSAMWKRPRFARVLAHLPSARVFAASKIFVLSRFHARTCTGDMRWISAM